MTESSTTKTNTGEHPLPSRTRMYLEEIEHLFGQIRQYPPQEPDAWLGVWARDLEESIGSMLTEWPAPAAREPRPTVEGFSSDRYGQANDILRTLLERSDDPSPEYLVETVQGLAATQGLPDFDYAHLLAEALLIWRRNNGPRMSLGWGCNLALYALDSIAEEHPLHWVLDAADSLIMGAAESIGYQEEQS
jgi:hypothetical protein